MHYLKFFLFHFLAIGSICALALGNSSIVIGFALISGFIIFGDLLLGEDVSVPKYQHEWLLTFQLWLALPLLSLLVFVAIWSVSSTDTLGFGVNLSQIFNYDFNFAKSQSNGWHIYFTILLTGLMIGSMGTVTAHELVHRKWGSVSHTIGRWLLSFSFDSNFAIEHVWGHHLNIATPADPASAPRGRNVYQHIWISTIDGNISAWNIEQKRLAQKQSSVWSLNNRCIRGYLMSIFVLAAAFLLGGWAGLGIVVASGVWAKMLLEIVNYMEHYGIVRVPGKVISTRHSWNTNNRISSWSLFNLTRHSHHHANARVQFQNLKPNHDAPKMLSGYLATIVLTLIPPLWYKLMAPKLKHWDENFASDAELQWLKEHG